MMGGRRRCLNEGSRPAVFEGRDWRWRAIVESSKRAEF
jgi:hypothetical protein